MNNINKLVSLLNEIASKPYLVNGSFRGIGLTEDAFFHGFVLTNSPDFREDIPEYSFQVSSLEMASEILAKFYSSGKTPEDVFRELYSIFEIEVNFKKPLFLHYIKKIGLVN